MALAGKSEAVSAKHHRRERPSGCCRRGTEPLNAPPASGSVTGRWGDRPKHSSDQGFRRADERNRMVFRVPTAGTWRQRPGQQWTCVGSSWRNVRLNTDGREIETHIHHAFLAPRSLNIAGASVAPWVGLR